jgi:EAL domain-containing protein (putative c-di-GMP-specific phosphodiesterase class I)
MIPLGRWVMREACHQVGLWQTAFPSDPPLVLSVNLSAGQFHDAGLVDDIVAVLGSSGLPASSLVLEVTESVLMKYGRLAAGKLGELRKLGVRLAIDNFGGNHSALSYLRELPVDIVKIDRSNVLSLGASGSDRELMQGIVALALKLNLLTVAEGVELDGQYTRLDAMGCELGQGYFFSRPQTPAVIEAVLRAVATGGDPRVTLAAAVAKQGGA